MYTQDCSGREGGTRQKDRGDTSSQPSAHNSLFADFMYPQCFAQVHEKVGVPGAFLSVASFLEPVKGTSCTCKFVDMQQNHFAFIIDPSAAAISAAIIIVIVIVIVSPAPNSGQPSLRDPRSQGCLGYHRTRAARRWCSTRLALSGLPIGTLV